MSKTSSKTEERIPAHSIAPDQLVADAIRKRPAMYLGGRDFWGYVNLVNGLVRELIRLGSRDIRWSRDGSDDVLCFDGPPPNVSAVHGLRYRDWRPQPDVDDGILELCVAEALSSSFGIEEQRDESQLRFCVDPQFVAASTPPPEAVRSYFRRLSHLYPGIAFTSDHEQPPVRYRSDGMTDLVRDIAAPLQLLHTPVAGTRSDEQGDVELAFAFHSAGGDFVHSFAACGRTQSGGTHEEGLRSAVAEVRGEAGIPQTVGFVGAVHVRSARYLRFAGCVRDRVETPELETLARDITRYAIQQVLRSQPSLFRTLAEIGAFRFR